MLYTSEFASIDGVNYKIDIQTETGSGTTKFVLGGSPFVTSMDSDGKTIYSPIKTVGATVEMVTPNLEYKIYSGKAQGTKITLTNTTAKKVEFVGYVTPCAYSQDWDNDRETIEIEAVDGISVLKNIPYPNNTGVETFGNVIFTCLKTAKCFTSLYISDNVQLSAGGNESVIEKFRVSQQNFFEARKDISQTDDDVAMSCYDVLFEICQYLGYTLFADGDEVYIIDYDAIKAGNNKYFKYSLSGASLGASTSVTKKYSKYIDGSAYSENGTSVSLDNVYNKVSVKDDFYTYDSLFPEFGDPKFEVNITADTDTGFSSLIGGYYQVGDIIQQTDKNGNSENYQIFVTKGWKGKIFLVIVKFYRSDVLEFCKYNRTTKANVTANYENKIGWSDLMKLHGAFYVRMYIKDLSQTNIFKQINFNFWLEDFKKRLAAAKTQDDKVKLWIELLNRDPKDVTLSPMIICTNHQKEGHIGPAAYNSTGSYARTENEDCRRYPYVKLRRFDSSVFGGSDAYLIINGKQLSHDKIDTPFPLSEGANNEKLDHKRDYKYNSEGFLWCRLKWGANYWNGTGWQTTATDFKLPYWKPEDGNPRVRTYYDRTYDFLDTAKKDILKGEKGYYITCPQNGNLSGDAEFIIYANRDLWGDSRKSHWHAADRYCRFYNTVQVLKDLTIKAEISNGLLDDMENDSDTIYTNVIPNGSVDKLSEIKFKVCTYDHKKPTYSSVDYMVNGKSEYLKYTVNKALNSKESSSVGSNKEGAKLVQEEHLIFKLVNQYQDPKVMLDVNLHNENHKLYGTYTDKTLSGKTFIAQEINTDYRNNQQSIKLLEKF